MSTNVQVYQTIKNEKKGKQINQRISNNKPLEQVSTLKYLWNVIDDKLKLSKHINFAAERNSKLVHGLYKSTKLKWGLKHKSLQTIYKVEDLPLLHYCASLWAEAMRFEYNRIKYVTVQSLMNIILSEAFRTTLSEALCVLAETTPIIIRTGEAVKPSAWSDEHCSS